MKMNENEWMKMNEWMKIENWKLKSLKNKSNNQPSFLHTNIYTQHIYQKEREKRKRKKRKKWRVKSENPRVI